jgi:hypothetical protein
MAVTPQTHWLYTAIVDVGEREDWGHTPQGQRFVVPILGGTFSGPFAQGVAGGLASDVPSPIQGIVLPGGADRQLLRPDGIKQLDALYEIKTDAGEVITVHNHVTIDESVTPERYARSHIVLTAPSGRLAWLNNRVFVGSLRPLMPARKAVEIGVYLVA